MYECGIKYSRTQEERNDVFKSWSRPDKNFFASGACHILAQLFISLHPELKPQMVHIKPKKGYIGDHVYVKCGDWAFDFNGWTKESELLEVNKISYRAKYPGWSCSTYVIKSNFSEWCHKTNHRTPEFFPELPWKRAYDYIQIFPTSPLN